jgi:hypothetical protein
MKKSTTAQAANTREPKQAVERFGSLLQGRRCAATGSSRGAVQRSWKLTVSVK